MDVLQELALSRLDVGMSGQVLPLFYSCQEEGRGARRLVHGYRHSHCQSGDYNSRGILGIQSSVQALICLVWLVLSASSLPHTSYVTLGKLLDLSVPRFPTCKLKMIIYL